MPLKPARRNYNCSDADLKATADQIANCVTRDIADFASYDIDADAVTAFQATITTFFDKTTDDESLGDQKTETDAKNSLRKDIEDLLRLIRTAAQLKYGGQGKYRKFGFDGFTNLSDNDFVRMVRRVIRVLTDLQTEMAASFPSVADKITILTTKGDAFDDAVDQIIDKKNARDIATQDRILAGNAVYAGLFKSSSIGKTLYQDTNEAKYNDYVLAFQGSAPGVPDETSTAVIKGVITDNQTNQPIANVHIVLDGTNYTADTDSEGSYEISSIAAGTYNIVLNAPNYYDMVSGPYVLEAGTIKTANLVLIPQGHIVGKVIDSITGNPIVGVNVIAEKDGGPVNDVFVLTDSNGNYSHTVVSGSYVLKISGPGYTNIQVALFPVATGQTITKNIQMVAEATITGHIQTQVPGGGDGGGPIAGASIVAEKQGVSGIVFTTTTDSNGNYYLAVAAGSYRVTVSKTGYQTASETFLDVAAGQTGTSSFALAPQS